MAGYGMLIDTTRCIGCKACTVACKQWNGNSTTLEQDKDHHGSYQNPERLYSKAWTIIEYREIGEGKDFSWNFNKKACMHCLHPACASVCPVGALHKTSAGPVRYDDWKCIGCRYCMMACPFEVPSFDWDKGLLEQPLIRKCILCYDRLYEPACAKACFSGAILYGERDKLIGEGEERIAKNPEKYLDHIYGKEEGGGTSILYLSSVPFEKIGLPDLASVHPTALTEKVMAGTLPFAAIWGTVLYGIYWLIKFRKDRMDKLENKEAGSSEGGKKA